MKLDIQDLKDRLDVLEDTTITSINEQISAINTSISDLKEMDESLDTYIKALEATATDLQKQINDANAEIAKVEAELGEEISVIEQTLLNELNTAKEAIEAELLAINNMLAELKQADEALDKKISDLQAYVDTQLTSTTNWANATFSTLAQYEQTQTEISTIKASIEQINAGVSALETRLNGKIASDIQTAIDALRSELSTDYIARIESAVNTMTQTYTTAISSAKDEITSAYTTAIETAISNSETSMKSWVNTLLAQGYYTISDIDGKVSALEALITDGDSNLQKQINEQKAALQQAKTDLTNEYKQYINQAIASGGIIDQAIATQVKKAQDELQSKIDIINERLDAFEDRLGKLEEDFVNRIQSLKYIPEYSDRIALMSDLTKSVLVDFLVTPMSQAALLVSEWERDNTIIKAYLRYTKVPETRAVSQSVPLRISSVFSSEDGLLSVALSENPSYPLSYDFLAGNSPAVIYLHVSDGNTEILSDLVDVRIYEDEVTSIVLSPYSDGKYQTANSYIVSDAGTYSFKAFKGNSQELAGASHENHPAGVISDAVVLWETFGTGIAPATGDLIKSVTYSGEDITFQTADTFKEGNAVIAAKDANGNILWSWHIWLTDQPQGQEYYNNAGTMMDRNLGATSATPGDVGALGLLYQWGRKDPFLGSSSINGGLTSHSTISWPSPVSSDPYKGTIDYTIANPTTFVTYNSINYDWYYTGSESTDNTRWTTSDKAKSIYDPCPAGWRVPDGGENGIWSKAFGTSSDFAMDYDDVNRGVNFGNGWDVWYPASGYRYYDDGGLRGVGLGGFCWSASPIDYSAYYLHFGYDGHVYPSFYSGRAGGQSVRCLQERIFEDEVTSIVLSPYSDGKYQTANSYIVSDAGTYSFKAFKGNSQELAGASHENHPAGVISDAVVLWETFGTDITPVTGDLIKSVTYSGEDITFQTADTFKEGNAVIAAKDAAGNTLWSWHLWFTDAPQSQRYNDAGTMMDRNLGAISAKPGDVGALGLLYQWGRKDPFLGSSSINSDLTSHSTISWPSPVSSDSYKGTIDYTIANPTTFVTYNSINYDWYYTGSESTDNTRWTTSDKAKSIYDPCPAGWRVPDGGENGIWSKAFGTSSRFDKVFDDVNRGMNFGNGWDVWYPASGCRGRNDGRLYNVGDNGVYWSASPSNYYAYYLNFGYSGYVYPSNNSDSDRTLGQSVRCLQE